MKVSRTQILLAVGAILLLAPICLVLVCNSMPSNTYRKLLPLLLALPVVYLVMLFAWMSRWNYVQRGDSLLRYNRFTGACEILDSVEWKPLKPGTAEKAIVDKGALLRKTRIPRLPHFARLSLLWAVGTLGLGCFALSIPWCVHLHRTEQSLSLIEETRRRFEADTTPPASPPDLLEIADKMYPRELKPLLETRKELAWKLSFAIVIGIGSVLFIGLDLTIHERGRARAATLPHLPPPRPPTA